MHGVCVCVCDAQDIWFLITRNPSLLAHPTTLQRWLDFLSAYGRLGSRLTPRDIENFLLRAPQGMLESVTLYQAGQVSYNH